MAKRNRFSSSNNPMMSEKVFAKARTEALHGNALDQAHGGRSMSINGSIQKTFILTLVLLAGAIVGWMNPSQLLLWGGAIGGLITVLIASARPQYSPYLAPVYALLEGLFLGSVSLLYSYIAGEDGSSMVSGIVINAVMLTMGVLASMLALYYFRVIEVTQKLRSGIMMATGAVLVVYLINIVLSFFGLSVPYLHEGGTIGLIISLVIIGIAAFNLLLDFDFIEKGSAMQALAYMEWFGAMSLLITLVWIYIEILRLLAIFSGDD